MKILKFTTLACAIMTLIAFGHADTQEKQQYEKAQQGSKSLGEIYQQEFRGYMPIPVMYLHNRKSINASNEQDLCGKSPSSIN